MDDTTPKLRIQLSGRRAVTIDIQDWPSLATATIEENDAKEFRSQANRITEINLHVRQHADGRALVYGVWTYATISQGEQSYTERAGLLVPPGGDLYAAITQVGRLLSEQTNHGPDDSRAERAVRECIADLPAEEL